MTAVRCAGCVIWCSPSYAWPVPGHRFHTKCWDLLYSPLAEPPVTTFPKCAPRVRPGGFEGAALRADVSDRSAVQ